MMTIPPSLFTTAKAATFLFSPLLANHKQTFWQTVEVLAFLADTLCRVLSIHQRIKYVVAILIQQFQLLGIGFIDIVNVQYTPRNLLVTNAVDGYKYQRSPVDAPSPESTLE
jgi:hypothetical protein